MCVATQLGGVSVCGLVGRDSLEGVETVDLSGRVGRDLSEGGGCVGVGKWVGIF